MLLICLAGIVYLHPLHCVAQWSSNPYSNTVVCVENGSQGGTILTEDGAGGAIFAWSDERNGNSDIYAQHFNADGVAQWAANGIPICKAPSHQYLKAIISDGAGGAIITWLDLRNNNDPNVFISDIYAQRVNGSGVVQWEDNGISISRPVGFMSQLAIASDNNGGEIISWADDRYNIYAQGINANGTLKWSEKAINTDLAIQIEPAIVSDGSGGAIIAWTDSRNQSDGTSAKDIYAQRINADGSVLWTTGGIGICQTSRFQDKPALTSDGSGGAIVTWLDDRDVSVSANNVDVYSQRINSNGVVQWAVNGIGVCTTTDVQSRPLITTDESGGAIIAWGTWTGFENTIALQRVSSNGNKLWMSNGVPIGSGGKEFPAIASDGNGGVILTWADKRNSVRDIYAQHVDANGAELWRPFGGVVVSNAPGEQYAPQLALDKNGGVIITWGDSRDIPSNVYAQHIMGDGTLGGGNVVGNQTITFNSIPTKKFSNTTFTLEAIASSNLPVTYTSSNLSVATVDGNILTIKGVGNSTITATQPGNANFNAALPVSQQLVIDKGDQTITFNTLPSKAVGDSPFTISATTSSDLVVSFTSSNTAVATISGNTVTIISFGSTNITASQTGNTNYNAAENVVQPFLVKSGQSISFSAIQDKTLGDPAFTIAATASSGLSPTFSSISDKISISGNQVTLLKAGSVTIKADQSGNVNFAPAPQQAQTFCIAPAKPVITVTGLDTDTPLLTSNSTSGNQWFKDGAAIVGATSQTFTISSVGVYTLVTSVDNCVSIPSDEKTFIITGIENLDDEVKVYPNPMNTQLHVDVSALGKSTLVSVVLYDAVGHVLHSSFVNETADLDVTSYQAGIYLLKIQSGKQTIVKKLTK